MTLHNGVATNFQVTALYSMKTESLASSQSCCSIDTDAWYKQALELKNKVVSRAHLPQASVNAVAMLR